MKAISLKQPWARLIELGHKRIETRTWSTNYRGDLLIVASKQPDWKMLGHWRKFSAATELFSDESMKYGQSICIVNLFDCRPMLEEDEKYACCELYPRAVAWDIDNIRPIEPFPVKGQLGIYDVEMIEELPARINNNSEIITEYEILLAKNDIEENGIPPTPARWQRKFGWGYTHASDVLDRFRFKVNQ